MLLLLYFFIFFYSSSLRAQFLIKINYFVCAAYKTHVSYTYSLHFYTVRGRVLSVTVMSPRICQKRDSGVVLTSTRLYDSIVLFALSTPAPVGCSTWNRRPCTCTCDICSICSTSQQNVRLWASRVRNVRVGRFLRDVNFGDVGSSS